jgi:hypothetical protein
MLITAKQGIIIEVKEIKWHDVKMCNYSHPFKQTSTKAPGRIKGVGINLSKQTTLTS